MVAPVRATTSRAPSACVSTQVGAPSICPLSMCFVDSFTAPNLLPSVVGRPADLRRESCHARLAKDVAGQQR
ncbi:hypothetical protein GCM10023169_38400 [Georgenia halophila]|uniref:Uncharacterized protein n=1 Tax=Georgenia halophila TaxID=620889 RepID=A0ABP8LPZ2_9MICO